MPDVPLPEDLSTYMRSLEQRIRALETAPRAQDTTLPWQYNYVDTYETTASTTLTDLATVGPIVSIDTTNTARVLVTASAYINSPANTTGVVALYVDGVYFSDLIANGNSTSATLALNLTNTRVIVDTVGLARGTHTFQLKYKTSLTLSGFGARLLTVQPF